MIGFPGFTPREDEVMTLVVQGMTEKQIAHVLGIGPDAVHKYRDRAKDKLGCASLPAAAAAYREWYVRAELSAPSPRRPRRREAASEPLELLG